MKVMLHLGVTPMFFLTFSAMHTPTTNGFNYLYFHDICFIFTLFSNKTDGSLNAERAQMTGNFARISPRPWRTQRWENSQIAEVTDYFPAVLFVWILSVRVVINHLYRSMQKGTPSSPTGGNVPTSSLTGEGACPCSPIGGYPIQPDRDTKRWGIPWNRRAYPHVQRSEMLVPLLGWMGVPHHQAGWGTHPPPTLWQDGGTPRVDKKTDTCQNITFPRTSYAGGKNLS